jgi:ribonuclease BN (tRNA processing enzyme)
MDDVTVTFLGSGDAFASGGRCYTCFLVESPDACFLIDCGATAAMAMKRHGVETTRIDAVVLSHLHGDHFGGVPFVVLDSQYLAGRTAPLAVAGPPGVAERVSNVTEALYPSLAEPGHLRFDIDYVELLPGTTHKIGAITVGAERALHGEPESTALALRVECGGKVIAFSGDTGWTDALLQVSAAADLFICEAAFYDKDIKGHLSYQTLIRRRSDFDCKRMILTHMGPDVLARLDDLEIEAASDGYQVTI